MPKVIFKTTGDGADCKSGDDLKEVFKTAGWPLPFGCEDGVCGSCVCKASEGAENLSKMDEKEEMTLEAMGLEEGGYLLACQRRVNGDVTLEQ